jgi:hypothetical protein
METFQKTGQHRAWCAPLFLERLRREGQHLCVNELIRAYVYHTSARLQLLSDWRARGERDVLTAELRNLGESSWQMGADVMTSICEELQSLEVQSDKTAERNELLLRLQKEARMVIHDMHAYARKLTQHRYVSDPRFPDVAKEVHGIRYDAPLYFLWLATRGTYETEQRRH